VCHSTSKEDLLHLLRTADLVTWGKWQVIHGEFLQCQIIQLLHQMSTYLLGGACIHIPISSLWANIPLGTRTC